MSSSAGVHVVDGFWGGSGSVFFRERVKQFAGGSNGSKPRTCLQSFGSTPSSALELLLPVAPTASPGSVPLPSRSGVAAVAPDQSRQKANVEEKKSAKNLLAAPPGKKSANTATTPFALSYRPREKVLEFWDGLPVERAKDAGRREKFLAIIDEMMAHQTSKG
jgi:hypothetical protein